MAILIMVKKHLTIIAALRIPKESLPLCLRGLQTPIYFIHTILVCLSVTLYNVSVFTFLFSKAKTFADYAEAIMFGSISFSRVPLYGILIFIRHDLRQLIADLEALIEQSILFLHN